MIAIDFLWVNQYSIATSMFTYAVSVNGAVSLLFEKDVPGKRRTVQHSTSLYIKVEYIGEVPPQLSQMGKENQMCKGRGTVSKRS